MKLFWTVFFAVLCALFASHEPEVAIGIVVAGVVVYVAIWVIGQFLEGYNGTTTESKTLDELWKEGK